MSHRCGFPTSFLVRKADLAEQAFAHPVPCITSEETVHIVRAVVERHNAHTACQRARVIRECSLLAAITPRAAAQFLG